MQSQESQEGNPDSSGPQTDPSIEHYGDQERPGSEETFLTQLINKASENTSARGGIRGRIFEAFGEFDGPAWLLLLLATIIGILMGLFIAL